MKIFDRRTIMSATLVAAGAYGVASLSVFSTMQKRALADRSRSIGRRKNGKQRLGPARYRILRLAGTERAYSSPLNKEKRKGVYACAGCNLGLYKSATKYESGTGWPSFWAPMPKTGLALRQTIRSAMPAPKCIARAAAGISGISSMMVQNRPAAHCLNGLALKFIPG